MPGHFIHYHGVHVSIPLVIVLTVFLAFIYIVPLHLPFLRKDSKVPGSKMVARGVSTVLSCAIGVFVVHLLDVTVPLHYGFKYIVGLYGFHFWHALSTCLAFVVLFLPTLLFFIKSKRLKVPTDISDIVVITFVPFAEEMMFRQIMPITLMTLSFNPMTACIVSSFIFGLLHFHHLTDKRKPRAEIFGQVAFSSLFGCLVSIVRVKSGSVFACMLCHSFCNYLGFPPFELMLTIEGPQFIFKSIAALFAFVALMVV
ncbi:hypothetical protein PCE1_003373 [Barthelona sp. PCE]